MIWTDLITGVILMLTGWAVYRNPMLISGVNTMSKKRLEKINLEGLKRDYRNVFLICGGAMLLFGGLSTFVQIPMDVHFIVLFVVMLALVIACFVFNKRYDMGMQGEEGKKERRKHWIGIIITIVVFAIVLFFFFKGSKPAMIEVSEDYITAKGGGYSASIALNDIAEANVLTDWPSFPIRTNGIATDDVGIGHFRKKGGESCMLFVCTDGGPLLEVRTVDGKLYYLNCATEEETMEMIAKVKSVIRSRQTTGYNDNHTFCPHGGRTVIPRKRNAISQARRRTLFAWEIAGQARNEGYGVRSVCQMKSKRR
ncbi:MAG: DUF3784 domain-containing protein [Bacteroidales bacterium]|nr:DUF3784 domain-containing protein [Bacteroidales bacterium]MBR6227611.1 DUF3784 domain-containing protein [Bacteroidales bacterium]